MTSLKNFFHLSVTGYCHVQATSVDTSWVSIQSITHFPFFIYVKQMHFPIEREISAWSVNLSSQTLIMDIANLELVAIIFAKWTIVTCIIRIVEMAMANLTHISYPIGDCWITDILVPNWWNMSLRNFRCFRGTCKNFIIFIFFLDKICFCLIIIKVNLQILGQNLLLKFQVHFLMDSFKKCKKKKIFFLISNNFFIFWKLNKNHFH